MFKVEIANPHSDPPLAWSAPVVCGCPVQWPDTQVVCPKCGKRADAANAPLFVASADADKEATSWVAKGYAARVVPS